MSIKKPIIRNVRAFINNEYSEWWRRQYIIDPRYAKNPSSYIRSFLLILEDLKNIFNYIEPSDINLKCYSFKIYEILLRSCIEFESNCKAILIENWYKKNPNDMNIIDYNKIEYTHNLSSYLVKVPFWSWSNNIRQPFKDWKDPLKGPLTWYQAYNTTKHNRQEEFSSATFENMIDSVCWLLVILSSQFYNNDFWPVNYLVTNGNNLDNFDSATWNYFEIKYPGNRKDELKYDFNREELKNNDNPFDKFDYSSI